MVARFSICLALALVVLSQACPASAAMIQFREDSLPDGSYQMAVMDMRSNTGNMDAIREGNNGVLIGRRNDGGDLTRILLGADISAIPSGSTITSVTLTLIKRSTDSSSADENHTITVHELVGTFLEDLTNGPSWNSRDAGTPTAWASAGGDFNTTVLSSYIGNPKSDADGTPYVFPSSSAWVAAAQNALDGSGSLYLLLRSEDSEEGSVRAWFQFNSDDPESGSPTIDEFPLLTIEYSPIPEPTSFALLGFAAIGVLLPACRRTR